MRIFVKRDRGSWDGYWVSMCPNMSVATRICAKAGRKAFGELDDDNRWRQFEVAVRATRRPTRKSAGKKKP